MAPVDAGGLVGGGVVVRGLEFAVRAATVGPGPERFASVVPTVKSAPTSSVALPFVCIACNVKFPEAKGARKVAENRPWPSTRTSCATTSAPTRNVTGEHGDVQKPLPSALTIPPGAAGSGRVSSVAPAPRRRGDASKTPPAPRVTTQRDREECSERFHRRPSDRVVHVLTRSRRATSWFLVCCRVFS